MIIYKHLEHSKGRALYIPYIKTRPFIREIKQRRSRARSVRAATCHEPQPATPTRTTKPEIG